MSSLFELPSRRVPAPLPRLASDANSATDGPTPNVDEARARAATRWRAAAWGLAAIVIVGLVAELLLQRQAAALPLVHASPVVRGRVAQSIPAVAAGRVAPASELTVRSEGAGRVSRVLIEPGDTVVAGDALFVLEGDELERAVRSAQSAYEMARAGAAEAALRAQLARRDAELTGTLVSSGSLARVEGENKRSHAEILAQAAAAARARVAGQRAELEGAQRASGRRVVQAPISGLVTALSAVLGESVGPGAPLASIADVSELHVTAQVDESDASRLELGMPVELRFEGDGGAALRSKLTRLAPKVSDTPHGSRVLGFEVALPERRKWRLGISVEVDVIVGERDAALLVPANAPIARGAEHQVFVFVDGRAVPRRVEPGLSNFAHVEIVRGLIAGELVIESPSSVGVSGPCEVRLDTTRSGGTLVPSQQR